MVLGMLWQEFRVLGGAVLWDLWWEPLLLGGVVLWELWWEPLLEGLLLGVLWGGPVVLGPAHGEDVLWNRAVEGRLHHVACMRLHSRWLLLPWVWQSAVFGDEGKPLLARVCIRLLLLLVHGRLGLEWLLWPQARNAQPCWVRVGHVEKLRGSRFLCSLPLQHLGGPPSPLLLLQRGRPEVSAGMAQPSLTI